MRATSRKDHFAEGPFRGRSVSRKDHFGEGSPAPATVPAAVPVSLPATVPAHASQMYAHNITTFLKHLRGDDGALSLDLDDEITAGTLVARGGAIVHPRLTQDGEQG